MLWDERERTWGRQGESGKYCSLCWKKEVEARDSFIWLCWRIEVACLRFLFSFHLTLRFMGHFLPGVLLNYMLPQIILSYGYSGSSISMTCRCILSPSHYSLFILKLKGVCDSVVSLVLHIWILKVSRETCKRYLESIYTEQDFIFTCCLIFHE